MGLAESGALPSATCVAVRDICRVASSRSAGIWRGRCSTGLRVVREQLRHADVQTTTGYTKLPQQDVRQALETFDNDGE
jgi:integrase